jgi:hypothetical protein
MIYIGVTTVGQAGYAATDFASTNPMATAWRLAQFPRSTCHLVQALRPKRASLGGWKAERGCMHHKQRVDTNSNTQYQRVVIVYSTRYQRVNIAQTRLGRHNSQGGTRTRELAAAVARRKGKAPHPSRGSAGGQNLGCQKVG